MVVGKNVQPILHTPHVANGFVTNTSKLPRLFWTKQYKTLGFFHLIHNQEHQNSEK